MGLRNDSDPAAGISGSALCTVHTCVGAKRTGGYTHALQPRKLAGGGVCNNTDKD